MCACANVSTQCAECPLYDDWSIEGSAEFHSTFFPLAHHVLHTLDLPLHQPLGLVLGVQMACKERPGKHRECVGAVIVSV